MLSLAQWMIIKGNGGSNQPFYENRKQPQKTPRTIPQTPRIPLQPVYANSSPAYPDFSRMGSSPSSTPPTTQFNRGMEWLTSLPESARAAFFASLEPSQMVTSASWNAGPGADDRDQSQGIHVFTSSNID
ncbi:hypothetical protein B0H19DRAFT_1243145 [Mycena capillaripes]|nr:hypothetical protein B0H19DRAFT_1243145 [Mycena capillaripes]